MDKQTLRGISASKGIYEGVVRVIPEIKNDPNFEEGEILVTHLTEPPMVIMMNKAGAIITDIGGVTSHAGIVSRELGIPCVVATKTGTTDLKTGMRVRVDGDNGEVTILE